MPIDVDALRQKYLDALAAALAGPKHYAQGDLDVDNWTPEELLKGLAALGPSPVIGGGSSLTVAEVET